MVVVATGTTDLQSSAFASFARRTLLPPDPVPPHPRKTEVHGTTGTTDVPDRAPSSCRLIEPSGAHANSRCCKCSWFRGQVVVDMARPKGEGLVSVIHGARRGRAR